ncbi:MAG: TrkH family potassium uptake protein [Rikenellaceae bacterium]
MRFYVVLRYIGVVMLFMALCMLISAGVSFAKGVDTAFYPLLLSSLLTALFGSFPMIFVARQTQISIKEAYAIVVGSWLLACVVSTFPYLIWGGEFNFVNAWFESVSGLTTTGASILTDIEALPDGLLFWRMMSTWVGGIGVIMFSLLVLPSMGKSRLAISNVEISPMAKENYRYRTQIIVRIILVVYVGLTAITAILLNVAGMSLFDSVAHAMSSAATSGFSTKNTSIAYFDSALIESILIFAMIGAGTHFGLIYATVTAKRINIFRSEVMRVYIIVMAVAAILIAINLVSAGVEGSILESIRVSVFQVVSIYTTTGFATTDTNLWPSFAVAILIFCSIVCACSGSTSGGIKTNRMIVAAKLFVNSMRQQRHPNAILKVKIDGSILDQSVLHTVAVFIVIYLSIAFIGTLLCTLFGLDLTSAVTASIACIGNVGPGFGEVGSMNNYAALPVVVKYILSFLMLLGRLEIFGLFQLFMLSWWR